MEGIMVNLHLMRNRKCSLFDKSSNYNQCNFSGLISPHIISYG